jgi:nitric oxide reductase subunit B
MAFLMYFLGFTNLLFGWAHHIYTVPTAPWVRYLSYAISMTELLILGRIIYQWRSSLSDAKKIFYNMSYKFLVASDFWIFANLILALLISIPAINIFTHGTHITVAHAMGSTIGINTMILICSCLFIIQDHKGREISVKDQKIIRSGFWMLNSALVVFWLSLIFAGAEKARLLIKERASFQHTMNEINPYLVSFAFSGIFMLAGICCVILPTVKMAMARKKITIPQQILTHEIRSSVQ